MTVTEHLIVGIFNRPLVEYVSHIDVDENVKGTIMQI